MMWCCGRPLPLFVLFLVLPSYVKGGARSVQADPAADPDAVAFPTTNPTLDSPKALEDFAEERGCGGVPSDGPARRHGVVCLFGAFASPDGPYAHAFLSVASMLHSAGISDIACAIVTGEGAVAFLADAAGMDASGPATLFAHLPFNHDDGTALTEAQPQWRRSDSGALPEFGAKRRLKKRMRHILNFLYTEALEPILYYPHQPRARLALRLSSHPKLAVPYGKEMALSEEVRTKLAAVGHAYRGRLHVVAVDLNEPSGQGDAFRKELNLRKQASGFKLLFWDPVAPGLPKHYSLTNGLALSAMRSWLGNPLSEHPAVPHRLPGFKKKKKKKIRKTRSKKAGRRMTSDL